MRKLYGKVSTKVIKDFINANFLTLKNIDSKKKILLIDRGLANFVIMNSTFAYVLNKKYQFNFDLLSDLSNQNYIVKIYESFGIKKKFDINIKNSFHNLKIISKSCYNFLVCFFKIIFFGKSWFIENYRLNDIYFGDLIYDTYIRRAHNFLKKNIINFNFLKILFTSIYKINFLNKLISKKNYQYVFAPTNTYASNSSLGMRIALKKKIKVISIISNRLRIYSKLSESEKAEFSLDVKNLKNKKFFPKNWLQKIDILIKNRNKGNLESFVIKDAYKDKKNINKEKLLKFLKIKKDFKRIVLFVPHVFSDANHVYGKMVFDDYYHQFLVTAELAKKDKTSLWIFKFHPQGYMYNEEKLNLELIKNYKQENIVICPKKFDTNSLIRISDLIITGRGTAGLESACNGKKPLLSGESYYSNFGITHNSLSIIDYKNKALNYKLNSKLTKKEILEAKKLYYLFHFKNSFVSEDKLKFSNYLRLNEKKSNLVQQYFSENNFTNLIAKQLKNKIDISNDNLFKHFEKLWLKMI